MGDYFVCFVFRWSDQIWSDQNKKYNKNNKCYLLFNEPVLHVVTVTVAVDVMVVVSLIVVVEYSTVVDVIVVDVYATVDMDNMVV